jgi:hypothetical protein
MHTCEACLQKKKSDVDVTTAKTNSFKYSRGEAICTRASIRASRLGTRYVDLFTCYSLLVSAFSPHNSISAACY